MTIRRRGPRSRGSLARGALALAGAAALACAPAAAAAAEPAPWITADRSSGLDPGGDVITVSGGGFAPGTALTLATWALVEDGTTGPADGGDGPDGAADLDTAVQVSADASGAFRAELAVNAGFAAALEPWLAGYELRASSGPGGRPPAAVPLAFALDDEADDPPEAGPDGGTGGTAPQTPPPASAQRTGTAPEAAPAAAEQRSAPRPQAAAERSAADPSLSVSQTTGLDPQGQTVTVEGSGFPVNRGVYVALCVDNGPGERPTPCVGGADMSGEGGHSAWISSNPLPYGEGLAIPYQGEGENGSFSVQIDVLAASGGTDCLAPGTSCVIAAFRDHLDIADRSLDVRVPVGFATAGGQGGGADQDDPAPSGTGGGTAGGSEGGTAGGGPLPRTGAALAPLAAAAGVLTLGGAAAMLAARRRGTGPDGSDPA
ncbi:cell wall protein [Allonocardiopsis opalescens]|uniref:Neocarzinostatin family protein n=1 Tax=Allonocardiopsis opalescens TaxID=1144618 RepID=A0A2T0Q9A6_9ACTN|nr:cell wall protein [Allonocardiopsis opalescens]PRY00390.1 hypothetical protein CLV72_10219 [Allonocardiopsis opalescens]